MGVSAQINCHKFYARCRAAKQAPVRELALHLLDIAENSVAANAQNITISVNEDSVADRLQMSTVDDGIGMDEATVARVIDPFFTSRTTRKVGL